MFELTKEEFSRSQFVILKEGRGHNFKYAPFAFTELGVAMLSSILNSDSAINIKDQVEIFVGQLSFIYRHYPIKRVSESFKTFTLPYLLYQIFLA